MIVNLKSMTDMSGFYIVFDGSTYIETPGIYGTSHLMEHLQCKNFEHLRDELESNGIDWNAYTSSGNIVFYFTGLEKNLNKYREELVDLITDFKITKEQFENEKNIVLQEYNSYFADQQSSHQLNLARKLFRDYDPIGLRKDLEGLKFMDVMKFYEKQFRNPTKIINVSKTPLKMDIDFSDLKSDKKYEFGPFDDVPLEKRSDFGDKASIIMVSPIYESDFNYITFLSSMLSVGLSSPLYTEVRENKGLVYSIRCGQTRYNNQGVVSISTKTSSDNVEKVYDAVRFVLGNPKKFMTKERFNTIKNSLLIKVEKEKINRYANVMRWISPPEWNIHTILKEVTYDDVMDIYDKYFDFDKFYLSYDKTEFGEK